MIKVKGFGVLGRCTLCRRFGLPWTRDLGHGIWACIGCISLINAAAAAPKPDVPPILFVGGPLTGAEIRRWRGDPSPELYVVRGHDDLAATLPTDRPPLGVPRDELGWYAFEDVRGPVYRWQGWLSDGE